MVGKGPNRFYARSDALVSPKIERGLCRFLTCIFSINNQQLLIKEIDTNLIRLQTSVNENDKKMLR